MGAILLISHMRYGHDTYALRTLLQLYKNIRDIVNGNHFVHYLNNLEALRRKSVKMTEIGLAGHNCYLIIPI